MKSRFHNHLSSHTVRSAVTEVKAPPTLDCVYVSSLFAVNVANRGQFVEYLSVVLVSCPNTSRDGARFLETIKDCAKYIPPDLAV